MSDLNSSSCPCDCLHGICSSASWTVQRCCAQDVSDMPQLLLARDLRIQQQHVGISYWLLGSMFECFVCHLGMCPQSPNLVHACLQAWSLDLQRCRKHLSGWLLDPPPMVCRLVCCALHEHTAFLHQFEHAQQARPCSKTGCFEGPS